MHLALIDIAKAFVNVSRPFNVLNKKCLSYNKAVFVLINILA